MLHSHEIDDIADRFRHWLQRTDEELENPRVVAIAEQLAHHAVDRAETKDSVGLLQLVESLTAMRHDYKLHAKSLRQLHEDVQASMTAMTHATRELDTAHANARQAIDKATTDAAKPLLTALMDVDDALHQAISTTEKSAESNRQDSSNNDLLADVEFIFQEIPKWKRLLLGKTWNRLRARFSTTRLSAADGEAKTRGDQTGMLEGLRILQARVRRALADAGVMPLTCTGKRLDPHTMRVVDVVEDAQLPPESVVDEVRVGYLWHDKVFRVAEVRVTKSQEHH